MEKDNSYYSHERSELLNLIPEYARTVLEIGCGTGNLGKLIKQRQSCEIYGIELDKNAAKIAESKLDKIYSGFVEDYIEILPQNYFDCIILADVLEHLKTPEPVLKELLKSLKDDGLILVSIPNFCHYSVIEKILWESFKYAPEGILDNTHISFYTKGSMVKMLTGLNLQISEIIYAKVFLNINNELINILKDNKIEIENFLLDANNFQYFMTAKKLPEKMKSGRGNFSDQPISIILTLTDNIEFNNISIEKVIKQTLLPYKLIIIGNFSVLDKLPELPPENTQVIQLNQEKSYTFYLNKAVNNADGEYILLLNANSCVGPGYLEGMLEHFNFFENTGIVVPVSNSGNDNQKINNVPYDIKGLNNFEDYSNYIKNRLPQSVNFSEIRFAHNTSEIKDVESFCMLLTKNLIEQIGGFDTRLENNFFADDYCLRANLKGFKVIVARDVFVHNFPEINQKRTENNDYEIYKTKWNMVNNTSDLNIKYTDNDIFFPLEQKEDTFFDQIDNIEGKDITGLIRNLKLDIIYEKNITSYYKITCLYLLIKNYSNALEYLQKLLKAEKLNKDLCILLSYTLEQLKDEKMSRFFNTKNNEITNYSTLHDKLKKVYALLSII